MTLGFSHYMMSAPSAALPLFLPHLPSFRSELEECLSGAAAHSDAGHQEGPGAELCKGWRPVTVLSLPQLLHRSLEKSSGSQWSASLWSGLR